MRHLVVRLGIGFALLVTGLAWAALKWLPDTGYYPYLSVSPAPGLTVEFLMSGEDDPQGCRSRIAAMSQSLASNCAGCKVTLRCERGLPAIHRLALGHAALDAVSMRVRGAVILFRAERLADATTSCSASQKQMNADLVVEPCTSPGMPRGERIR